jgi:DNA-binding winged helix-turn-helix (wHTH) protein/tetratricopeptide (TPR) repeat protein
MTRPLLSSQPGQEAGFTFGNLRIEADGTLLRGKTEIHLLPKELAALRLLLAHPGRIVTATQLQEALWGDVFVTADSVPKCVSSLRAKLAPDEYIQTVYKRGYRLSVDVQPLEAEASPALSRLAIIPFASSFDIGEHLGPAIAEETITRLTRCSPIPVSVLARDSVFTLVRRGLTALQIGRTLGADLVLTGTLRALPEHIRLRAEMIRVPDGVQIWVEDLLVEKARVAGLDSELAERLISRLGSAGRYISPTPAPSVANDRDPIRQQAYELFLRGHQEWQTLQRHRMQDGLQHLSRAAELDPTLISAHIDLVNVCVTQAFYGFMSPAVAAEQVRNTARAIPADLSGTEAILPALGWLSFHIDYDLPSAAQAFERSAYLPHDAWITRLRVMFALSRHRFDKAIQLLRAALRVDPFSLWLHARLGWAYHLAGQAEQSTGQIEEALSMFPGHEGVNLYGSIILAYNGDADRAAALAENLVKNSPYFDIAAAAHGYALARAGRSDEARTALERLQWLSRERYVLRSFNPAICVALGDIEGAMAELRAAEDARCPWFFQTLADPRLEPLHAHPEFQRMCGFLEAMEATVESGQPG